MSADGPLSLCCSPRAARVRRSQMLHKKHYRTFSLFGRHDCSVFRRVLARQRFCWELSPHSGEEARKTPHGRSHAELALLNNTLGGTQVPPPEAAFTQWQVRGGRRGYAVSLALWHNTHPKARSRRAYGFRHVPGLCGKDSMRLRRCPRRCLMRPVRRAICGWYHLQHTFLTLPLRLHRGISARFHPGHNAFRPRPPLQGI